MNDGPLSGVPLRRLTAGNEGDTGLVTSPPMLEELISRPKR
jgi:hypothetical protein